MPSPEKKSTRNDEHIISRTYRTAIRIGEDFITLEETITLPMDASDDDVAQAVELGWRIYRAQRAAVEEQVATIREAAPAAHAIAIKDPDAPASEKQRNYIAALQEDLTWSNEQLASYADEQSVDLVALTKGQASSFIDGMKKLAEDRSNYTAEPKAGTRETAATTPPAQARPNDETPANDKQIIALERLAQQHNLNLNQESQRRFGVASKALTGAQASALLREWQQRPATRRLPESAL